MNPISKIFRWLKKCHTNPTFSILPHKPQFLCLDDFIANCKIPLAELIEKEAQPVHDIWVNLEPKVGLRWSEFNHLSLFICHLSLVILYLSLVTCQLSLVTCHFYIFHWSFVTCQLSLVILIILLIIIPIIIMIIPIIIMIIMIIIININIINIINIIININITISGLSGLFSG